MSRSGLSATRTAPAGGSAIEGDGEGWTQVLAQPAGWEDKVEEELQYLDAEEVRLRYVAATRARELLVVGRWAKPGNGRPWGTFDQFLAGVPELPVPHERCRAGRPSAEDLGCLARRREGPA